VPTAAGSRADPWVRADTFPEDDVVQQPRLQQTEERTVVVEASPVELDVC